MSIKSLIFIFIFAFILWKLYFFVSDWFDGHWGVPVAFVIFLIFGRIALFIYRRSKGIRDTYLD